MDARARLGAGRERARLRRVGGALKNAAAICERPALWTQAKITVFMRPPATTSREPTSDHLRRRCRTARERASEKSAGRGSRADQLRDDEAGHVGGANAGEGVGRRARQVTAGFANDVEAVNQYAAVM